MLEFSWSLWAAPVRGAGLEQRPVSVLEVQHAVAEAEAVYGAVDGRYVVLAIEAFFSERRRQDLRSRRSLR
jgi:hypothetical protein